jgi:hypothetical protein
MSDRVIYMDVDNESKVSLRVVDRLDAGSQPQILELPTEQEILELPTDDDDRVFNWNFTQIVACDNLLAVLFRKASEIFKVFLWNRESETWLANLDTTHLITNSTVPLFTISRNLLAVTCLSSCYKTFFWRLDTRHPDASLPQFLGIVSDSPRNYVSSVTMNEKWIVRCCSNRIRSIEKTRLFCGDQNQVAVEAQQVDPGLPQNPWQLVKLNEMEIDYESVTLEPGSSSRLGILLDNYNIFQILNLATGETVCCVSLGSNLHPVSWLNGNFLLFKELEPNSDNGKRFQIVVFDLSRGSNSMVKLEEEEACLLSGPTFNYSGASDIDDDTISIDWLRTMRGMIHMDYSGLVLAVAPILFIASID